MFKKASARRLLATTVVSAIGLSLLAGVETQAGAVPAPIAQRTPTAVTADALPTVQIDGVVWTQAVAGNTVWAGGSFAKARPAGSAPGVNTVTRSNLLAYDITTGNLISSIVPSTNAEVKAIAVSPDGSRVYVGGAFTTANGASHNRIAAYNATTGALISTFNAGTNAEINAIVATNTTVYVGGFFSSANGSNRTRLAAFDTSGNLLSWAPTADNNEVEAMVLTKDGTRLIAGGSFTSANGSGSAYGLASLDPVTGALYPWAANSVVQDGGTAAAILSLTTDGNAVYGNGYVFGAGGNLEGTFSADPDSGTINWIEDCHGDTYGNFPVNGIDYTISHAHYCGNIGGYPQTAPNWSFQHALAFTAAATGTLLHNGEGGSAYADFGGQPSPTLINWFPDFTEGTYTGESQAAWSISGNSNYLTLGGEFPTVNGAAQQGLVRFAVPALAPKKQGPMISGYFFKARELALSTSSIRVSWQANWDRDDENLSYKLVRDGDINHPIYTATQTSQFWNLPTMSFTDTGLAAGSSHQYRLYVTDPDGNQAIGDYSVGTTLTTASPYASGVITDGASTYWRLDESTNGTSNDSAGFNDLTEGAGVTPGAAGAIIGDPDTADTFSGTSTGWADGDTPAPVTAPNTFTIESWIKTSTTKGGKIVGYGDGEAGTLSSSYDRQVYMDNAGHLIFGVYTGATSTVASAAKYNDSAWHHVVATLSAAGMNLFVDGKLVGHNASVTAGQAYDGYWHIGGDNLGSWPSQPTSNFFAGTIDDVAIYPTALNLTQVDAHYTNSGRTIVVPTAPSDAYGKAVFNLSPDLYWRMDDASGPTAADASGNDSTGLYSGTETFTTPSTVAGATGTAVTFDGATGTTGSTQQFANPTTYTEMAWIKTTTTHGGKIIGFGDAQTGLSQSYDRHVYMLNDGQIQFGTWTGAENLATSPLNYNDGNWHQVVATQSSAGMKLYVDGQLVGSNAQTAAQAYTGYWRVGGDVVWSGDSNYFAGSIDEVSVFATTALSQAQIQAVYTASPAAVNAAPTASFTSTCTAGACSFNAAASADPDGSVASYAWNFGDGTPVGTGVAPTHNYAATGTYTVSLVVTDNRGLASAAATNNVSVTVVPNQPPVANFTATPTNLSVAFNAAASSDPDGTIASYSWNFGDGTALGTTVNPTHVYTAGGNYTVVLTVTDNQGASTSSSQVVAAVAPNKPPVAAFTQTVSNLSVAFDGSTSADPDGTIASYSWNYGDGTALDTTVSPTHVFAATGSYTVALTVTDNQGASNTVSKTIAVAANQPPVAAFTSTATNLSVAFDGSSSADPDGTIASYSWNFGDGTALSTDPKPTHVYAAAGSYNVTLTVTDNQGASGPVSHTVVVSAANQSPTAAFTSTVTNLSVAFDGSTSADPDGTIASYSWNFGDGTAASTAVKPTHVYAAAGSYNVTLTVTDNQGATGQLTQAVVAVAPPNQAPTAAFTSTVSNLSVAFDGSTSADPDGTIASYSWNFGDGPTVSTAVKPTHVYAAAGSYNVTLTVTDNQGATGQVTHTVVAVAPPVNQPPVSAFTSTVTNLSVAFDGSTSADPDGTIASYSWNFGDGTAASTVVKPTHVYAAAGSYNVTLTVTDNQGATSQVTHAVVVAAPTNKPPVASFTSAPVNLTVSFNASASADPDGTIASYAWSFGDGTTGTGVTASHTYASAGTFTVTLTVTDNQGATNTASASVLVNPATALFSDTFTRTTAGSFGTADKGGAWTNFGAGAADFSTNGTVGQLTMSVPFDGPYAMLSSVSQTNLNLLVDSGMSKVATGNGSFMEVLLRDQGAGNNDYRFKVRYMTGGVVHIVITKVVNGSETFLTEVNVAGLTWAVGDMLRARVTISGSGTTTIAGKVWKVGTTEPVANQVSLTDTEPSLQSPGAVGVQALLAGNATNAPVVMKFDNLSATAS